MVKKFISGILGRKESKAEGGGRSEEVPEELPPLAEDVVKASEESKKDKVKAVAKESEKEEVLEELPPLEGEQDKSEEIKATIEDLEKEDIPEEIKKAKLAKTKSVTATDTVKDTEEKVQEIKQVYAKDIKVEGIGFFSNILEHIKKHGAKERLLAGDLFGRMGSYWELRKHDIKTGMQMPAEKKLEENLMNKIEELKVSEQKWQVQKLALEEDMKFIHEREREIQAKVEELKLISNELSLFRNVQPEEYFYMHNGVVLKSLHDLIDVLEVIDEETFKFHVRNNKNDFSEWVRHVFKDDKLADKIKNAKIKMEMIEILETIPVSSKEIEKNFFLNPKKYFWLANSSAIRNLYELSDALKLMDEELFKKHVDEKKNDFAKWVNDAFKNEHLAEKLNNAKTKKEMVDILEVFL